MSNDEIIRLIGKIRERYDQVHEPSGNVVRIEVDLLRADIRELYEKISSLAELKFEHSVSITQPDEAIQEVQANTAILQPKDLEPEPPQPEFHEHEAPVRIEPVSEPEIPEPSGEEPSDHNHESDYAVSVDDAEKEEAMAPAPSVQEPKLAFFQPEAPEADSIVEIETPHEISIDPGHIEPAHEAPVKQTANPAHIPLDLFGAPAVTLADKFRDEKRSINEKMNQETPGSIGTRLRIKITDLHSAIGINDRFIFINELFEGNMRSYDELLGRLNTCASLQEALEIFNQARAMHGWSDELNSADRLLDFIHRRHD